MTDYIPFLFVMLGLLFANERWHKNKHKKKNQRRLIMGGIIFSGALWILILS
jgi:uncharacterized membrane protein